MIRIRVGIAAVMIVAQSACDGRPFSPAPAASDEMARVNGTLSGPAVVRLSPGPEYEETDRVALRGTRRPSGCDYSYEHVMRSSGKVVGWTAEYDPTTCDFVIATGRYTGPATSGPSSFTSPRDSTRVEGAPWPSSAARTAARSVGTGGPSASPVGEFRVVTPFTRAAAVAANRAAVAARFKVTIKHVRQTAQITPFRTIDATSV